MPEGPQSDPSGDALRKRKREHLKGSAVRWSAHCESRSVALTMGGSLMFSCTARSRRFKDKHVCTGEGSTDVWA